MKMWWQTIASSVSIRTISPTATPLPKAYGCVAVYIADRRTNLVVYGWRPKPPTNNDYVITAGNVNEFSPTSRGIAWQDSIRRCHRVKSGWLFGLRFNGKLWRDVAYVKRTLTELHIYSLKETYWWKKGVTNTAKSYINAISVCSGHKNMLCATWSFRSSRLFSCIVHDEISTLFFQMSFHYLNGTCHNRGFSRYNIAWCVFSFGILYAFIFDNCVNYTSTSHFVE